LLQDAGVRIEIFSSSGKLTANIDKGWLTTGNYNYSFNTESMSGATYASGIWYWKITATNFSGSSTVTSKMVIIR